MENRRTLSAGKNKNIVSSFVHEYDNDSYEVDTETVPALWHIDNNSEELISYPFPRNIDDFEVYEDLITGELPLSDAENFNRLPRFGLTGISKSDGEIYAGSWNGVYEIDGSDFSLNQIISNRLMNDLHGIWTNGDVIITILTGKDTVVISDMNGDIIDHFTITPDLNVCTNDKLEEYDWRFLSKQFRGAVGHFHFNNVYKRGDDIWLTSRNANGFVVVDLETKSAEIKLANFSTPAEIHDGVLHEDNYIYLTSVDGKIFKVATPESDPVNDPDFDLTYEVDNLDDAGVFNRAMPVDHIRLENTGFRREPNWCRGIDCSGDRMMVNIDGRYGTSHYGLVELNWDGKLFNHHRLNWSDVGDSDKIRYVTGFDVENI